MLNKLQKLLRYDHCDRRKNVQQSLRSYGNHTLAIVVARETLALSRRSSQSLAGCRKHRSTFSLPIGAIEAIKQNLLFCEFDCLTLLF